VIVAPGRRGLLLKLFFGAHAESGALIALVERHKRRAEEQLVVLERIEAEIGPEGSLHAVGLRENDRRGAGRVTVTGASSCPNEDSRATSCRPR
jgi:hypothetical protein